DEDDGACEVTAVEGLPPRGRESDGVDDDIGAEASSALLDRGDDLVLAHALRRHGVRGTEVAGPGQLLLIDVEGDDRVRSGQSRTGDRRAADTAGADHGHRLAAGDLTGVDGGTDPGHHSAAE